MYESFYKQLSVVKLFEDINGGLDPQPIERLRRNLDTDVVQMENILGLNNTTGIGTGERAQTNGAVTPGNSGRSNQIVQFASSFFLKLSVDILTMLFKFSIPLTGDDVSSIPSAGSGNSLPSFTSHFSSGRLVFLLSNTRFLILFGNFYIL